MTGGVTYHIPMVDSIVALRTQQMCYSLRVACVCANRGGLLRTHHTETLPLAKSARTPLHNILLFRLHTTEGWTNRM